MRRIRDVRQGGDDGVAILMSLFVIMMVAAVSIAMAAAIINQVTPTQEARKQVVTISAASTGLQVALSNMRDATDPTGNFGLITELPCTGTDADFDLGPSGSTSTDGASISGAVRDGAASPEYDVSIAYFTADPTGKDATWLAANALDCPLTTVPYYAFIQAYGQGAQIPGNTVTQGDRTQTAVYQFKTTNTNVVGGRLVEFGTNYCLDVGNASTATVGTTLTFQPCLALGTASQTWQYRNDLTLFWGGDVSKNLCIQASSTMAPQLKSCATDGTNSVTTYSSGYPGGTTQQQQEWPFNDNGHFAAAKSDGNVDGTCLQPATANTTNAALILTSCSGGTTDPQAFNPDPQVGAGKAGGVITGTPDAPTYQYVNYAFFGRCLDITGQSVGADHLIAYPCKQAPNPTLVAFNQHWATSAAVGSYGTFYVVCPAGRGDCTAGVKYCLTAPTTGNLITTKACLTTPPDSQLWKATGKLIGNYSGSYNLVNKSGKCMSASDVSELTAGSPNIVVEDCNGSLPQKWNAPPTDDTKGLSNIQEVAGG